MEKAEIRTLSVGLVGLCHLHPRSYMASLRAVSGLQVVAAADSNTAVLEGFTKDFSLRGYADWREMLETERLDLVVIFLPPSKCVDAAVAFAERRVHVLVEKPMAASSAGVRQMMTAVSKAGVMLSTPLVWRYNPAARQMKRFFEDGTLGHIVTCEGRLSAGSPSRYITGNADWVLNRALSGGGPMCNLGVLWIDLFRWLLEDEVIDVVGKNIHSSQDYDIEDNSFALLTFARGTVLMLDISYRPDSYPIGRDLYIGARGTRGAVSWTPAFESLVERLSIFSDTAEFASAPRRQIDFELEAQPGYSGIMGIQFLRDLSHSIRTGSPPPIGGEDGLRALEIVEAIYRSAKIGTSVQLAPF
jgi:predicted dehydrogenase